MSIKLVMPSNHLILCRPFLLPPSVFASIKIFSSESVLRIRWPRYWSFSFSISPSNEYSGLISFRMDWFDLLAVQGTLKSSPRPQVKSINSSALNFLYGPILISIHVIFLIIAILIDLWWCFILVLICIFLMTSNIKHLVLCLMAIWVSALEKCLFWYSLH